MRFSFSFINFRNVKKRKNVILFIGVGIIIILFLVDSFLFNINDFPPGLQFSIKNQVDTFTDWLTFESPFRPLIFEPISDVIETTIVWMEIQLIQLPWIVFMAAIFFLALGIGGHRLAILSIASFLFMGFVGLWDSAMATLTLMGVSVFVSLIIGIPLGVMASRNIRVDAVVRSILDTMQTMPAFVYLIPVMMLFGLGRVAGVIATIIYAIPPVTRLTNLGIRQVSPETIEASQSFGARAIQTLTKVELPLAMPSILLGLNQTIMMALSMVVIAALVGSRGLGADVWSAMRRIEVGRGLEGGLAIVLMAIILDRISYTLSDKDRRQYLPIGLSKENSRFREILKRYKLLIIACTTLFLLSIFGQGISILNDFPSEWNLSFAETIDESVRWMNIHLYSYTSRLHEILFLYGLKPIRDFLIWLPWGALLIGVALTSYAVAGLRTALLSIIGILFIGFLGQWDFSVDTLSQVVTAVLLSIVIAIPLGILASRSDNFEALLRPVLDTLQTMPNFVYLIPVVMLFGVGAVSGLIATIIYAVPPAIRLTNLGIRQVSEEVVEASRAYGASPFQTLVKVQLPLAIPSIMLGINQTVMMALAMVIVTALIGATGLGLEVVLSIGRMQVGRGFEASIAIVLLAIILDRITQALAIKQKEALALRK